MSERKINLEEILKKHSNICIDDYECVLSAMKEACEQTLELAAENANLEYCESEWEIPEDAVGIVENAYGYHYIDKQSILDTINQIE